MVPRAKNNVDLEIREHFNADLRKPGKTRGDIFTCFDALDHDNPVNFERKV